MSDKREDNLKSRRAHCKTTEIRLVIVAETTLIYSLHCSLQNALAACQYSTVAILEWNIIISFNLVA